MSRLAYALLVMSLLGCPFSVLAVETDVDLFVGGGYSDNITQAGDGWQIPAALGRSILDIGLNWKTGKTDNVFLRLNGDTEHFFKVSIPGNTKASIKPGYRFSLLGGALDTTVSYRLTKNWKHLISTGGASRSIDTYEYLSTDPYVSHKGSISSRYYFDKWKVGTAFDFDRKLYSVDNRNESIIGAEVNAGFSPASTVELGVSAGNEVLNSNITNSSYVGPFFEGLGLVQLMPHFFVMALYRYSIRDYGAIHDDRNKMLLLNLEVELTPSISLEGDFINTDNSSSHSSYSFQSTEFSSGVSFHF